MNKTFDCVEMKNRIQAKMLENEQRLGIPETRRRRQEWLARGDDPLARWWRSLAGAATPAPASALAREDATNYHAQPDKEDAP